MKCCKDCTKRFVGCHSQCQKYIVAKVIHTYKRDKIGKEKDLIFNDTHYDRLSKGNMRKVDGFKWKTYNGEE